MNNMKKHVLTLRAVKLLKELNFEEDCICFYRKAKCDIHRGSKTIKKGRMEFVIGDTSKISREDKKVWDIYRAPFKMQALKWLIAKMDFYAGVSIEGVHSVSIRKTDRVLHKTHLFKPQEYVWQEDASESDERLFLRLIEDVDMHMFRYNKKNKNVPK